MTATDFEATLRSLAPLDLAEVPIYVALVSELGSEDLIPATAGGCTGAAQDLVLRPWLQTQGRYRGRGFSMIIKDSLHCDLELDEEIVEALILKTCVHELAHCLDRGLPPTGDCNPIEAGLEIAAYRSAVRQNRKDENNVPWLGHGLSWLRITGHLAWRASAAGHFVDMSLAARPDQYGLSLGRQYAQTLDAECAAFVNRSLIELQDFPPPQDFIDLWRADLVRWTQCGDTEEQKTHRREMLLGF